MTTGDFVFGRKNKKMTDKEAFIPFNRMHRIITPIEITKVPCQVCKIDFFDLMEEDKEFICDECKDN